MPMLFAHHANSSPNSAVAAITAPPTTSEWPLIYFVVECTTISAPNLIGFCNAGDKNVLSAATSAPHCLAVSVTALISVKRKIGLLGVSIQISLGLIARMRVKLSLLVKSTTSSFNKPRFSSEVNKR